MSPAGAAARLQAFALDYLVIFAYLTALAALGTFLTLGPGGVEWNALMSSPVRADLVAFLSTVLPVWLYFSLSEASPAAATWGKRRTGLRVVGPDGRPGLSRSLARSGLKLLPWQMAHTAMFHIPGFPFSPGDPPVWSVACLILAWTLVGVYVLGLTRVFGGRTPYDRIAATAVVSAPRGV